MITKKYQVLTLQQQEVHYPDEITFYTPTSRLLNTYEEAITWIEELQPQIYEQHFIIQEVFIVS